MDEPSTIVQIGGIGSKCQIQAAENLRLVLMVNCALIASVPKSLEGGVTVTAYYFEKGENGHAYIVFGSAKSTWKIIWS